MCCTSRPLHRNFLAVTVFKIILNSDTCHVICFFLRHFLRFIVSFLNALRSGIYENTNFRGLFSFLNGEINFCYSNFSF